MKFLVYDLETYPNIFTFCGYDCETKQWFLFEISDRKNQRDELIAFLQYYQSQPDYYFVGYNNVGFDYPIIHALMVNPATFTYQLASGLANQIIHDRDNFRPIWESDRKIKQIDLYKINHFDNRARATSLKALQFAMRSNSVEDLPYDIRPLTDHEKDELIKYNFHDVSETINFLDKCRHLIKLRKDIIDTKMIYGDVLNMSDVKIGSEFLIKEIGRDKCFNQQRQPLQTQIQQVDLKDIILPKISFLDDKYEAVKRWFETMTWHAYKENNITMQHTINDFTFHFGVGGIHGSVENSKFFSNDEWQIIDLDVASLYPSLGIANNFYPTHLGEMFVEKYKGLKEKRFQHAKGTALNAMYKLALNGAYGNSNNPYSPFYDPSYMLKITINGQLQILQLAELLFSVPNVKPIQVNTDGITCYVHKSAMEFFKLHQIWWQKETGLDLEEALYSKMYIRDVNNYIAVTTKGKIKAKGAYWYPQSESDYDGVWNKDYSGMVIQKAVHLSLIENVNPEYAVKMFHDPFDFMMRYKTPPGAQLYIGEEPCSKTVRYYVSNNGKPLFKTAKPKGPIGSWKRKNSLTDEFYDKILKEIPKGAWDERIHTKNKSTWDTTMTRIEAGKLVKQCNRASDFSFEDLNYDYYIKEVEKLLL